MAKTKARRVGNKPAAELHLTPILWFAVGMAMGALLFACAEGKLSGSIPASGFRKLRSMQTQPKTNEPNTKEIRKAFDRVDVSAKDVNPEMASFANEEIRKEKVSNKDWTTCLPAQSKIPDIIYRSVVDSEDEAVKQVVRKAVMESQEPSVKAIIEDVRKNHLLTEAIKAIQEYDSETLACLVEDLTDVNQIVSDSALPTDYYMVLIEAEATVDITSSKGATPLHVASEFGSTSVAKILLKSGAAIEAKDGSAMTPLCLASGSKLSHNVVRLLIAKGAEVDGRCGSDNKTPLDAAAHTGTERSAKILIAAGADLQSKDKYHRTPLHYAAWKCNLKVVKVLLTAGVSKTAVTTDNLPPAHYGQNRCPDDQSELNELLSP